MSVVELSNLSLGVLSLASTLCLGHFIFLLFYFFCFCFSSRKKQRQKEKKTKQKQETRNLHKHLSNECPFSAKGRQTILEHTVVQWPIHHKFLKAHDSELKLVFRRPQVQLSQGAFFILSNFTWVEYHWITIQSLRSTNNGFLVFASF